MIESSTNEGQKSRKSAFWVKIDKLLYIDRLFLKFLDWKQYLVINFTCSKNTKKGGALHGSQ
jgi:hypothetical protein